MFFSENGWSNMIIESILSPYTKIALLYRDLK